MTLTEQFNQLVAKTAEASRDYEVLIKLSLQLDVQNLSPEDHELLSDVDRARANFRSCERNLCLFVLNNYDLIRVEEKNGSH